MKSILAPYTCPACDRFIDSNPECPYCGVDSPRRPIQHTLQLSAITLSLAGLVLLLLIARESCPTSVSIAQLRPVMNHGWVTLSGTATGHLYLVAGKPPRLYLDSVQPSIWRAPTKFVLYEN